VTIFKKNTEDESTFNITHTIRCLRIVATDIKSVILLCIKVKQKLSSARRRRIGGVEVQLYSSLNSAPDGVSGQRHAPAALLPGKEPRYKLEVGWAPEPVWTLIEEENLLLLPGFERRIVQTVV
jgi:predicted GH43/DUF377 family glycosyl hydrolase